MNDLALPTDLSAVLRLLQGIEVKTVLAFATAIVSVWLFLRRYREEARKTRITRLETKALDQLFHFREQLVACLDRLDDLPKISDPASAQTFWAGLRTIRRDVRKSIDEYALFTSAAEYRGHAQAFAEADQHYRAIFTDLVAARINYNLVHQYQRFLYGLLEGVEARILEIQSLDGRSRAEETAAVRSKYRRLRDKIDAKVNQPTDWVPVQSAPNGSGTPNVAAPLSSGSEEMDKGG